MPVILAAQKAEIRKITVQRACLARVRSQVQTPGTTKKINKIKHLARCWWLTPVILAAQEVEIGRITVQSQPGKKF
jgi:hypothetical protein